MGTGKAPMSADVRTSTQCPNYCHGLKELLTAGNRLLYVREGFVK